MDYLGVDFFHLDALLTDEERLIRDTVRSFVGERVLPVIRDHYRAGTFPKELVPAIADLGLFGATIPGVGSGLTPVAYGLVMQELERGDSGVRSMVSVQSALCMFPISKWGSDAQKSKWLKPMARGEKIGCFGLTEPNHGSDPGGMETKARKDGAHYVLDGEKTWITNGTLADVAIVWAKTEDGVVRGFLVEKGTPGFTSSDIHGKLSLRASVTSSLRLERCRVPKDALLPGTDGLKCPLQCLTEARYGIAWGAVGAAMACYDEALQYSKTRTQFGKPIASFQLVQEKLVGMLTGITAGQLISYRLGRLKQEGAIKHWHVSLAKRHNVRMALEAARTTREILGANGITDDFQAMRHACNLETVYTYEGTHDIHTLIVGHQVTGIDAVA